MWNIEVLQDFFKGRTTSCWSLSGNDICWLNKLTIHSSTEDDFFTLQKYEDIKSIYGHRRKNADIQVSHDFTECVQSFQKKKACQRNTNSETFVIPLDDPMSVSPTVVGLEDGLEAAAAGFWFFSGIGILFKGEGNMKVS